jgi:phosphatidylglycerol:prolipoprotein diacylglycerol transferase
VLASIPYRTFPTLPIGPVDLHVFGVAVATGMLAGIAIAARLMPPAVSRDDIVNLATRMVLVGVVGARLTWVVTHWGSLDGPLDAIAVWQGGLQFSGGFLAAVAVGLPTFRRWPPGRRWEVLDRMAVGLTVGLAIGRIGCYAVGEHLGRPTRFFLATRYLGGDTREGPLQAGVAIHNTSLYEFLHLLVLAGLLGWLVVRAAGRYPAGTAVGVFCLWYGVARFATDTLRAYDDRIAHLTGAQWMCLALTLAGAAILRAERAGPGPAPAEQADGRPDTGDGVDGNR